MACKLQRVPDTSEYQVPTGTRLVLVTKDHIGQVLISKAEYAGQQLVPPGTATNRIEFDVVAGAKALTMVVVFSASINGRGELREDADPDSQFLIDLPGGEPFQLLRITGK